MEFPRLRVLDLGLSMKLEKRLAKALLRVTFPGWGAIRKTDPVISQCLDKIGRMRSLEEFV